MFSLYFLSNQGLNIQVFFQSIFITQLFFLILSHIIDVVLDLVICFCSLVLGSHNVKKNIQGVWVNVQFGK
jgi:hypothetical protein